jgi:carbonic anhydrase/acetyltransferase-like protein (isoleucine patch superfamily)
MSPAERRRARGYRPEAESCEARLLLSLAHLPPSELAALRPLYAPGYVHPIRPNTPALPFGQSADSSTFLDTSVRVFDGNSIVVGRNSYLAPYATLDARRGLMKVGAGSFVGDNATLVANPDGQPGRPFLRVGEQAVIDAGALVLGGSQVGAFGPASQPTYVGPNAVIDGATVAPGAYVGAGAYVGPGVNVPAGVAIAPGASVPTQAAVGSTPVTAAQYLHVRTVLSDAVSLASGYTTLYQGNRATGPSPGTTNATVFNGFLPAAEGVSPAPALPTIGASGLKSVTPTFPSPHIGPVPATFYHFRARVIGGVVFNQGPSDVALGLARSDSIRADVGRSITFDGAFGRLGSFSTIYLPRGGKLTVGSNLRMGDHAVLIGGPSAAVGSDVTIGDGAVVSGSSLGDGVVVGSGAIVEDSTLPAGTVVPPHAVVLGAGAKS